mmetsp:Transcript_47091/g.121672  ORF Transcript_47091/g.121672 Transcript_47091/m.121672 type:complete len:439 (-) Transcript_47091:1627-2943(-)
MGQGHGAAAGGGHTERGTFRPHSAASKAEKRRHILAQVVPDRTSANVEELRGEFDPEVGTSRDHARRPPSSRSRPGSSSRRSRVAPSPTLEQQPALPHSTSNNVEVVRNEGMNREEGSSEHMSEDLSRMAKYLGLDMLRDQAYMWIAEEALFADLPADWEEYRDSGDHVYYYNAKSGQTTWNHPLDPYYKFLTAKLKKMHANGRKKMSVEDMAKDRGLVDLLWVMETEQTPARAANVGGGPQHHGGGVREERSFDLHTADDVSARESEASRSESRSEFMSATSRASTPGSVTEGEGIVPGEVKDIARYLGIDLKLMDAPLTPEEVMEMCRCLGIDSRREFYLIPIAKLALQVPLPEEWEVYKDEHDRPYYYNTQTRERSYRHPSDDFFLMQVRQERVKRLLSTGITPNHGKLAWLLAQLAGFLRAARTKCSKMGEGEP